MHKSVHTFETKTACIVYSEKKSNFLSFYCLCVTLYYSNKVTSRFFLFIRYHVINSSPPPGCCYGHIRKGTADQQHGGRLFLHCEKVHQQSFIEFQHRLPLCDDQPRQLRAGVWLQVARSFSTSLKSWFCLVLHIYYIDTCPFPASSASSHPSGRCCITSCGRASRLQHCRTSSVVSAARSVWCRAAYSRASSTRWASRAPKTPRLRSWWDRSIQKYLTHS